jgi:hypothetical protein
LSNLGAKGDDKIIAINVPRIVQAAMSTREIPRREWECTHAARAVLQILVIGAPGNSLCTQRRREHTFYLT